jgi:DNA-binding response OmpR family regulator
MKILIVDDDPVVALSCRRVLEAEGMEVHSATSVEMGESMLAAERFDLLLTDIKMPGRDGFEMISQARKIRPNMPVLMMTGYMTPETIEQGRRFGAENHIAKPFTPDELIGAVRKIG